MFRMMPPPGAFEEAAKAVPLIHEPARVRMPVTWYAASGPHGAALKANEGAHSCCVGT
jgi:hypothetical protein